VRRHRLLYHPLLCVCLLAVAGWRLRHYSMLLPLSAGFVLRASVLLPALPCRTSTCALCCAVCLLPKQSVCPLQWRSWL
jgi:hypothetical protein